MTRYLNFFFVLIFYLPKIHLQLHRNNYSFIFNNLSFFGFTCLYTIFIGGVSEIDRILYLRKYFVSFCNQFRLELKR